MPRKHILIDACVAAAAYALKSTRSAKLASRANVLLTGFSPECEPQLLIPNFCIAETFAVFEKYRWGASWNPHVNPKTRLTAREFRTARKSFHRAIHNGSRLLQIELNRYHVLCLDLIAPINAAYRIKRDRGKKKNVSPARTYDLLFISMGIWLQNQLGSDNFVVVTGDERIALIIRRAKSVSLARSMRRHLRTVAKGIGLQYGSSIYPEVIDLVHCNRSQLVSTFSSWRPQW